MNEVNETYQYSSLTKVSCLRGDLRVKLQADLPAFYLLVAPANRMWAEKNHYLVVIVKCASQKDSYEPVHKYEQGNHVQFADRPHRQWLYPKMLIARLLPQRHLADTN